MPPQSCSRTTSQVLQNLDVEQQFSINRSGLMLFRPGYRVSQVVVYGSGPRLTEQWYHLAATYTGAKNSVYINGATCSTCSASANGLVGSINHLKIGGGASFKGRIDEVRIYNRALSITDIAELYQATAFENSPMPIPAPPTNLRTAARDTDSITLSWTPSAETYVTRYLLYKNSALAAVIESPNTSYKVSNLSYGTSYTFQLSALTDKAIEGEKSAIVEVATEGARPAQRTAPKYLSRIQISGNLSPNATGTYELQNSKVNDLPFWKRSDGLFVVYHLNPSILVLSKGTASADYELGNWTWRYKSSGVSSASKNYSGVADLRGVEEPNFPTPAQYLAARSAPIFKAGHTLPPLTKWAWPFSYEMKVEMARWGYALDLGDADSTTLTRLQDPHSEESKLVALARDNPERYKIFVGVPRIPTEQIPASAYTVDAQGNQTTIFSPEAPYEALSAMAAYLAGNLKKVADIVPIAVILNGGERYMGVCGFACRNWGADPRVLAAKGSRSWAEYQSDRKAYQERIFADAFRAVSPASTYLWYAAAGNYFRSQSCSTWSDWDYDYKTMHNVPDYPNASMYYGEMNSGWTGRATWTGCLGSSSSDMLSQVLNGFGYAKTFGHKLSYNWVCGGWPQYGFGDPERYYGFLKSYYTSGMIGGIAGYFSYPDEGFNPLFDVNWPPHWVGQVETLGRVHAEFSYLEDILRGGDLLPGPDINEKNPDQAAYEFRTGYADTRVLVRKLAGRKRWLISAWAADAVTRNVAINIPDLGPLKVTARPATNLYDARIVAGKRVVTLLDDGLMAPAPLSVPNTTPDADGAALAPAAPKSLIVTHKVTEHGM